MRMAMPGPRRLRGGRVEMASLSLMSVGRQSESTNVELGGGATSRSMDAAWSGSVDDSD